MNRTIKKETLTCPSKACGKTFSEPLTTLNLRQNPKERYLACPYCLTKIDIDTEGSIQQEKVEKETPINGNLPRENQGKEKLSNCTHYFGYMSLEENKKQMPEECMLCSQIIECMVKEKRHDV